MSRQGRPQHVMQAQFARLRGAFFAVGLFSCLVNLLLLASPIFMLQIYDRVLTSQSVPTLLALLALVAGLLAALGLLEFFRTRTLSRMGVWLDAQLAPAAYSLWIARSLTGYRPGYRPLQDLATLRGFFSSPTILALFDLPWVVVSLAVVFVLHAQLGLMALAGGLVVLVMALFNELLSAFALSRAAGEEQAETRFAELGRTNAESVRAMGMVGNTMTRWQALRGRALASAQSGFERSEAFAALSRVIRLLLQSGLLALGAYLAIRQEISAGAVIAAAIIGGRALAPLDRVIGGWRDLKQARLANGRLRDYLRPDGTNRPSLHKLPDPKGLITAEAITKFAPSDRYGEGKALLSNVSFTLHPGDGLGVIGPSASGKSVLARVMVGLWRPDRGAFRLDGSPLDQWDADVIGPHIGYMPQNVTLLSGTIAQNISRFEPVTDQRALVEAAMMAGVHEMILGFPDGYSTEVDAAISPLTGGQIQRIALARAVYRKPLLVVLDEPNSNVDLEGDHALANAIVALRQSGSVVIVMAHRPSTIAAVDQVMMLDHGQVAEYGPKADILRKLTQPAGS